MDQAPLSSEQNANLNNPIQSPEPKKSRKIWFVYLGIAAAVLLAASAYGAYYYKQNLQLKACTQEAKLCSDGSYVSRTGPNCEFAICPEDATAGLAPSPASGSGEGWQTYTMSNMGLK